MDNHKLFMIFIFCFLKHEKDAFFIFYKNMLEKILKFSRMYKNKNKKIKRKLTYIF